MIDLTEYEKFLEQSDDFIKLCARRLRRGTDPRRIIKSIEDRASDPYILATIRNS